MNINLQQEDKERKEQKMMDKTVLSRQRGSSSFKKEVVPGNVK